MDTDALLGGYVDKASPPPEGRFDIGLVMAGAISAGAYTAGVVDFLIEALDAWEKAKAEQKAENSDPKTWSIPGHDVQIRIMAGASAGSITAAIAAAALNYDFPHVSVRRPYDDNDNPGKNNPLYKAWVKDIDISLLLDDKDLQNGVAVKSVLDGTVLDQIATDAIRYAGPAVAPRQYLAAPVRYVFTIGNLRGVPYFVDFTGRKGAGLGMLSHADWVSYCVNYNNADPFSLYKDDQKLKFPYAAHKEQWDMFATAALGSGAFPIGLPPRRISKDGSDYRYRFAVVPDPVKAGWTAKALIPTWPNNAPPNPYGAVVVDGGVMNNEPIEIARVELSGLTGRNPRGGDEADRAILMIDPFPDTIDRIDDPSHEQADDLLHSALSLLEAWKEQARFKPIDVALAEDDRVYSRFLISPSRDNSEESNGFDIACGGLGGFAGFLHEAFREHDYLLGRRNCQQFLREHFCLPVTNKKVFARVDIERVANEWIVDDNGIPSLPIIPLVGNLKNEEPLPPWPVKVVKNLGDLGNQIDDRFEKVISRLLKTTVHLNFIEEFAAEAGLRAIRKKLVNKIINTVRDDLTRRNLY